MVLRKVRGSKQSHQEGQYVEIAAETMLGIDIFQLRAMMVQYKYREVHGMLVNAEPEQFSLMYNPTPCAPEDTVLLFQGDTVLLRENESQSRFPTWRELSESVLIGTPMHAFTQGAQRFFLVDAEVTQAPAGLALAPLNVFRAFPSAQDAIALLTAYHLHRWYEQNRFCGVCGALMRAADSERALVCDQCGAVRYPTISPAVIVAITHQDQLLLARNAHGAFKHYSLIAGYVEAGESLEQAARREIREEVGLRVKNLRYIASQPWGLSQSLMVGFHAELDGDPTITLQESELAEAHWFTRDTLPDHAGPVSIAYTLIDLYRNGQLK